MDPYVEYRLRRERTPVYWDEERRLWAVYSYRACREVLMHPATGIPAVADGSLGGVALEVKRRLVRLSNPPAHDLAREMALRMFRGRKAVDVGELVGRLVGADVMIEWVSRVARVLPAMHILAGFGFSEEDMEVVLGQLQAALKVMAPVKDDEAARALEAAFEWVYPIVDRQVARCFPGLTKETQEYAVSNLIGLLIQSHDATKGLLSLALNHLVKREKAGVLASRDSDFFLSFVTEVLRYDSPVHNTRRVLTEDVVIGGQRVEAGSTVLVVVAAGNRDPDHFERPEEFDRNRANNSSMLSFGQGIHGCIAGAYCIELAAQAMSYLFHRYGRVEVEEAEPEYEPLVNVRMVKELHLLLG